ncbi:hypothetical protein GOP47_0020857 [Adiantum capillus-veneris]|uniref:VPS37 C-terminal domain-containing protein n=1 Tax=Adiantum capillus-veneris TaxID=13818 RepID=A0A9D4UAD1_ADICA|nr:hypothetical protein GOP47_0020857 [Adiantum capillus-veneris]
MWPYSNGSYPQQSWYPTPQYVPEPTSAGGNSSSPQINEFRPFSSQPPTGSSSSDVFLALRNKSTEELQRFLSDQDAYNAFLHSSDAVKQIESVWKEMVNRNVELAKQNLEKESDLFQLKNQCTIIRTTELAAAQERFNEVRKKETDIKALFSPAVLIERLQDAASKIDDESEGLFKQLLSEEISVSDFLQSYRKMRYLYHKRTLTRLAAKTSMLIQG